MMKFAVLAVTFLALVATAAGYRHARQASWRGTARTNIRTRSVAGSACDLSNCVCYPQFGCFRKRAQCLENSAPLPESPQKIGTSFGLYTRGNKAIQTITTTMPATALYVAGFDARQHTKIAIHGWTQNANAFDGLKNVLLQQGDYNVILVDWEKGAGLTGRWPLAYTQPVQNTRVVGKHVAMLISHLQTATGIDPSTVHIIGASLGAQAAGYAGMYLNGTVGRISALDPSKPNFEGQSNECKLEKTDAQFVDVIHTNMDVAGVAESIGHVDFFPNGGRNQPGCTSPICSHLRAKSFFRSSVWTECKFRTRRCDGQPCGRQGCPSMGFKAFKPRDYLQGGNFCLTTIDRPPYCSDLPESPKIGTPSSPKLSGGNNAQVGWGNDQTTWINHDQPVQPPHHGGARPGNDPGVRSSNSIPNSGAGANHRTYSEAEGFEKLRGSGVRHQTFFTAFTIISSVMILGLL